MFRAAKNGLKGVAVLVCLTCLPLAMAADKPVGDFVLQLGGVQFDPLANPAALPESWSRSPSANNAEDLHLVQFDGPISPQTLADLDANGLEVVQYIHPYTYIVWGHRTARQGLDLSGPVRWTGDFAPGFRVLPKWRGLPDDPVDARVLIYRGGNADAVVRVLGALGGALTERMTINEEFELVGVTIPGDRLNTAATIPGVYSIQLPTDDGGSRAEVASQISAGNVDMANLALPGYEAWLTTVGLDGSGVVVALVDEGADEAHPDLANNMLPCVGDTCSTFRSDHGTHIAGTIVGDNTTGELNNAGFLRGLGTAPAAKLFEQYWRDQYRLPGGMLRLMTQSTTNGAVLSNNSWGSSINALGYNLDSLLVDAGVRDADPDTAGSQPLIYLQAIDNGAGGVSTQGAPDDAKNVFTIGATEASADGNGAPAANINDLGFTSAHGPALDGRTIPHMVAPGCYIDSTLMDMGGGAEFGFRCGTSMATAHVSGAVALFIEYFRGLTGADPSPALVKAAFMPVAHDLEGGLDVDLNPMGHRPGPKQGWGRMNLAAVVDPADPVLYFDQTTVFDFTGQEWTRVVTQANPAQPMRVMLVWTDAPGHGLGGNTPAWNNNLDLEFDAGGQTYLGNDFGMDGLSTTGGTADGMNNAEGVALTTVAGNATIRVKGTDINSNGVPHFGDRTDQDFAVVCYNCALVPDFALSVAPAPFKVCAGQPGELDVEVSQLAGFGDPVTLMVSGVPAGAIAGFSTNPVNPPATPVFTLDAGTAVDGDYTLDIQGDSSSLTRTVSLNLSVHTTFPTPATLTSPVDLAIDVSTRPTLEWGATSWTDRYFVEIATAPDFLDIVYSAITLSPSHTVPHHLKQLATYHWRVRGTNACGYGSVSGTFSFTTLDVPDVLLVDDDYDIPNEQNEYSSVLDGLGVTYDIWDVWAVHIGIEPDLDILAPYDTIIWYSGSEEVYAGPNDASERDLPEWLDHGGCLLISSIDYHLSMFSSVTDFMQQRLGVASIGEDVGMTSITGQGAAYTGLGPMGLANATPDYRDSITPDGTAELAFSGDLGDAGINKDGGWYRTSFLGFGIESLGTADKPLVLDAFLTWCAGLGAVDGDGDGVTNENDCVAGDANAWGKPQPITDLMLSKGAIGFSWSEPVGGSRSRYDILRSVDPTDFLNATCSSAGSINTYAPEDPFVGEVGQVLFYLVGARNECGVSTLGNDLGGMPRYGTACDAEAEWW